MEQQPENAKSPEIIDPNPGSGVESHGGSEPTTSLTTPGHPTATKWCSPKAGQSGFSLVCNSMATNVVSLALESTSPASNSSCLSCCSRLCCGGLLLHLTITLAQVKHLVVILMSLNKMCEIKRMDFQGDVVSPWCGQVGRFCGLHHQVLGQLLGQGNTTEKQHVDKQTKLIS